MLEDDAYSVLARSVVKTGVEPGDGRTWDDATVGLAAGVLQRAFRLGEDAREAFLELARNEERGTGAGDRTMARSLETTPLGRRDVTKR